MAKCVTCHHPDLKAINDLLLAGTSYRNVGEKYGIEISSLWRHTHNCLKADSIILKRRSEAAFNFEGELLKLYRKAHKMVDALTDWLVDPEDPDKFDISPRDTEIMVTYLDYQDLTEQNKPRRKKAPLSDLLERVDAPGRYSTEKVASMAVDNRKLFLDAFKTLGDRLEQYGKFHGLWQQDRPNAKELSKEFVDRYSLPPGQIEELESRFEQ